MKVIKYRFLSCEVNHGTEENPDIKQIFMEKVVSPWTAENETIVKAEAYNGEYTIEDDGEPEPSPSQIDRIEAQCTYTAMMTDTLMTED